jgi:hypothetical protein
VEQGDFGGQYETGMSRRELPHCPRNKYDLIPESVVCSMSVSTLEVRASAIVAPDRRITREAIMMHQGMCIANSGHQLLTREYRRPSRLRAQGYVTARRICLGLTDATDSHRSSD